MTAADLPHTYPFRFVETILEERSPDFSRGTVKANVSANGAASRGGAWQSPLLLAEAIAQAALLLEGGGAEAGRRGYLAGIEAFEAARSPEPGESLTVQVRIAARFGAIVRFEGEVRSGEESLARGSVLVRRGEAPPG